METQTEDIYSRIEIKSANQWMREARGRPVPKRLFGELWLEGELSVMFADTGAGKSILATAIAESVARGRSMGPFEITARPQKVLYIDFDLSAKQFEMRYSADHDPARGEFLRKPYRFSQRFQRIELTAEMLPQTALDKSDVELRRMLEKLVKRSGARVLIIDSISHLKRTADDTRGWAAVLKSLKRLKDEMGISILVLAHTLKRSVWRPIVAGDALGSRSISNYADNIFTIGRCRTDAGLRYIKHIRPRSSEQIYSTEHVPAFRIAKRGGNFLCFDFRGFAAESDLIRAQADEQDWQLIEKVKGLSETGLSIRQIAAELDISKTTVHRYLHTPLPENNEFSDELDDKDEEATITKLWNYFPGREEFNAVASDPRFEGIYDREDGEAYALRREAYLIEVATANARKQYEQTGQAPTFAEAWAEVMAKWGAEVTSVPGAVATGYRGDINPVAPAPGTDSIAVQAEPDAEPTGTLTAAPNTRTDPSAVFNTSALLKLSWDGYGREIFVESETSNGKPLVWYQSDSKGNKFRHIRNASGISREQLIE